MIKSRPTTDLYHKKGRGCKAPAYILLCENNHYMLYITPAVKGLNDLPMLVPLYFSTLYAYNNKLPANSITKKHSKKKIKAIVFIFYASNNEYF
jgi:hypothetical protein